MFLIGLGTATPDRCYRQEEGWEIAKHAAQFQRLSVRSRSIIRKVLLSDNGIDTRYLALESLHEAFELNPDVLHARFLKHAPAVAAKAVERALADAAIEKTVVDGLIISTCTGYLCPGLTSYVAERIGLRPDIVALDLVGQGCGAALPNFRTAEALLTSGRCSHVLSVCVEICSAAFYLDDDPGVLVSACLFGDGAGAVLFSREPKSDRRRIQWKAAASLLDPTSREYLRFEQKNGMLRNILTKQVPALAAKQVEVMLSRLLNEAGLRRLEISQWILHAGGREVLAAMREQLGLEDHHLRWSSSVLRRLGNVSSPCVIFVLQEALAHSAPGGAWCMCSFGAGFSSHGAILQVD